MAAPAMEVAVECRKTGGFRTLRTAGGISQKVQSISARITMSEWPDARKPGRRGFPTPLCYRFGRSVTSGPWARSVLEGWDRLDVSRPVKAAIKRRREDG